jgi:hypothetical protein
LFWGPEIAQSFVSQQQFCADDSGWRNKTWAEGGVVIDDYRHQLLFFCGSDLLFDIPLRRLYLKLIRHVWKGWEIQWAHDGILDIAAYVGYPRRDLFESYDPGPEDTALHEPDEPEQIKIVASIRTDNDIFRFLPLDGFLEDILLGGESLVEAMRERAHLSPLFLADLDIDFPISGFHIDLVTKKLSFWSADAAGITDNLPRYWPGWQIDWLKDNYEAHVSLTQNRLSLPTISDENLLVQMEKILLSKTPRRVDGLLRLVDDLRQRDKEVQVNPDALHESPLELAIEFRRRVFSEAVAAWKKEHAD